MIREFAIEPSALENDRFADWVVYHTGIDTGQYISELPRKWKKLIFQLPGDSLRNKLIIESLRSNKSIVRFRENYDWNSQANWQTNAQRLHTEKAFDVILQLENIENHKYVVTPDQLRSRKNELQGTQFKKVARNVEEMTAYLESLAIVSEKLEFCDPYLHSLERKHMAFLEGMFKCCKGSKKKDIRIHTRLGKKDDEYINGRVNDFRTKLRPLLRRSDFAESIQVIFWSEYDSGARFHDRWFLTDLGGYNIGSGFDTKEDDENMIRRVDKDEFHHVSSTFNETGNTYDNLRQFSISEDR